MRANGFLKFSHEIGVSVNFDENTYIEVAYERLINDGWDLLRLEVGHLQSIFKVIFVKCKVA